MSNFTVIPEDTFDDLQLDAGIILTEFDPVNPASFKMADIVCATTGGIDAKSKPTYTDMGEDIDNCPNNMLENKKLDSVECTMGVTSVGTSAEKIRLALGAAHIDPSDPSHVLIDDIGIVDPSRFKSIWWVGDKSNGGCVAIKLKNALSTDGFSLKTSKKGKGQVAITFTGHVSIKNQKEVPMEFYSIDPKSITATENFTGDGTKKDFTLTHTPTAITSVTVGGTAVTAYTQSGTTISFTTAPKADAAIVVTYTY